MGREVKRVPPGFDWPLNKTWAGFLMPEWLHEDSCPRCEHGYSPEAERFFDEWYGYAPFDPASTGSTPFTVETPAVRAFAERNVAHSPSFYGAGETAIVREAERLLEHWNGMWMHHLSQDDVDVLIEADRLWELTRTWDPETRWTPKVPAVHLTSAEVNEWSLRGFGHDSSNAGYCIRARCKREGVPHLCATCKGRASVEAFKGQRKLAKKWKPIKVPTGDWWQIWETVSEGSPITPAFATPEELAAHYGKGDIGSATYESTLTWITGDGWAPSGLAIGGVFKTSDQIITGAVS